MKQLVVALILFGIVSAGLLSMPLTKKHNEIRHTKYYKQELHSTFHHLRIQHFQQLVQEAELSTTLVGFTLGLEVQGMHYEFSVDTGSSDIFIKGEQSQGDPQERYVCGQSCIDNNPHVSIGYLDGPLQTYAKTLNVDFNGHNFDCPLLVAYDVSENFEDQEGLIGLSYPALARHQPTFIQTLINEEIIDKYAYGMNLNIIQPDRAFITFGDSDEELYEGELVMYDIISTGSIRIDFGSIKIGNGEEMFIRKALLDTGNTCISVPRQHEDIILQSFNSASNKCFFQVQAYITMFSLLRCRVSDFDELPDIELNIQGNPYTITKQYYLQGCEERDGDYFCDTYIESMESWSGQTIFLGDGFFNSFYTYFDLQNHQVGIAHNKENLTIEKVLTLNTLDLEEEDWKEWDNLV